MRHRLVNASQHRITVGGNAVYGMLFEPGYGYHVDNTTGVPTGNDPESIYAVVSGTHFNDDCCEYAARKPASTHPPTHL